MNILLFLFVIGTGENTKTIPRDTLPIKDNSSWEKLSLGVGYSVGMSGTGQDLRKYDGEGGILSIIARQLYWLNSIQGSVTYLVNYDWGIEVGYGYGWAKIDKHSSLSYDIENILLNLSLIHNKHIIGISYIDAQITKITGSESFYYYQGKGKGYKISYCHQINKFFGLNINLGQVEYKIIQDENEYKINQYLNGIEFSIGHRFNL